MPSVRGEDGSIAIGMSHRPYQPVVPGEAARSLDRPSAASARTLRPRIRPVTEEVPVQKLLRRSFSAHSRGFPEAASYRGVTMRAGRLPRVLE